MSKLSIFISGLTGLSIGSVVTYFITKKCSEKHYEKEIEEMREYVNSKLSEKEIKELKKEIGVVSPSEVHFEKNKEFEQNFQKGLYSTYAEKIENYHSKEDEMVRFSIISRDEYNAFPEFIKKEAMFYEMSGVLTDAITDEPLNIDETIGGFDTLRHFGEEDEDYMWVRDIKMKTDWEIVKSYEAFVE